MAIVFPSDDFINAFKDEINKSPGYRAAAAKWEGAIVMVVTAEPDRNLHEDWAMYLDLYHGECRDAKRVPDAAGSHAPYTLTAPLSRWEQVVKKELDPVKGMVQGKLKLKGDLPTIVRYVKAAQELVECATRVDVVFPDQQ